jgi:uroporphyrinogen-III synthase
MVSSPSQLANDVSAQPTLLVVTRPEDAALSARIADQQTQAQPAMQLVHLPLLELHIADLDESPELQVQLQRARHADLLIFVSRFAASCAHLLAPQLRQNQTAAWYAVGPATAQTVQQLFGVSVIQPAPGAAHSEGLLERMQTRAGQRAALFAAAEGRQCLREQLQQRGVHVDLIEVYQRRRAVPAAALLARLRAAPERIVFTASSAQLLHAVVDVLAQLQRSPAQTTLIVSAARIERLALQLGFGDVRLAASADLADLVTVLHRTEQR